ncbi:hypothetical protein GOBAR_AA19663 [Gossypium barbadense]|uniref:UBA domain-containing protein n=1 Tax=Gossypium barbadense TaxID=3634 RepID=A0A2P5XCC1_GOSBA|nr:hypothetical protein GOBAR_AA19663 [Gossypium barbadense]
MEVNMNLLGKLESLGFPRARAVRGLHHTGNTTVEDAVNWLIDHENDADIDQMPLVVINLDLETPQPNDITEAIKLKEQELRDRVRMKNRDEEKKLEREREKLERKQALGLPLENRAANPPLPSIQEEKDDNAKVKKAFQTLLIYVGNVARSPDEEKFRKIRLSNPKFQERVGSLKGGIKFLELCGFERSEGDEFLVFPRDKVDVQSLNTAGSLLKSALTNPYFGLLEKMKED